MLTEKQVEEIREHLDKAQNPLFFFDNDQDGLCSFLLLRRSFEKGKGVPVKNTPMGKEYFRRVNEFEPDYIFILDQPVVSKEFFEEVEKINLPVVWIDHHEYGEKIPGFVSYYNPLLNKEKTSEPVTALCYQVSREKSSWLGVVGCIADKFVPDFYDDFLKEYRELGIKSEKAFEILYNSDIGKIAQILGNGLKDKTTNVMAMIRFLIKVKSPHEVLEESKENQVFYKRSNDLKSKLDDLYDKAKSHLTDSNVLFFKYAGEMSMSADLANRLSYNHPKKISVVCRIKGDRSSISVRGKNIKEKFLKIIEEFDDAGGGGHDDAIGLQMNTKDLDPFHDKLKEVFDKQKP